MTTIRIWLNEKMPQSEKVKPYALKFQDIIPKDKEWHQLVITTDNGIEKVYLDGKEI